MSAFDSQLKLRYQNDIFFEKWGSEVSDTEKLLKIFEEPSLSTQLPRDQSTTPVDSVPGITERVDALVIGGTPASAGTVVYSYVVMYAMMSRCVCVNVCLIYFRLPTTSIYIQNLDYSADTDCQP